MAIAEPLNPGHRETEGRRKHCFNSRASTATVSTITYHTINVNWEMQNVVMQTWPLFEDSLLENVACSFKKNNNNKKKHGRQINSILSEKYYGAYPVPF